MLGTMYRTKGDILDDDYLQSFHITIVENDDWVPTGVLNHNGDEMYKTCKQLSMGFDLG